MEARDGAHSVVGLLVGRTGLVAVLVAEVARGALGNVQALGDRAQVGEVVKADAPNVTPLLWRAVLD